MRLDQALHARGLARSRSQAADLIRLGRASVGGVVVTKPSYDVGDETRVELDADRYVSRAAHKLAGALDDSATAVPARVLDAGASTGGFTQVLLERGAQRVYAVDVGHGQLVDSIRCDARVVVHEGTNLRHLTIDHVEGKPAHHKAGCGSR